MNLDRIYLFDWEISVSNRSRHEDFVRNQRISKEAFIKANKTHTCLELCYTDKVLEQINSYSDGQITNKKPLLSND